MSTKMLSYDKFIMFEKLSRVLEDIKNKIQIEHLQMKTILDTLTIDYTSPNKRLVNLQ